MKKTFSLVIALLTLAAPAWAIDLSSAKQQGLVGEQMNGMIGAIAPAPTSDIRELVTSVNTGRAAVYKDMAVKQGVGVAEVQAIAAKKLYEKETAGNYLQVNGQWSRKK